MADGPQQGFQRPFPKTAFNEYKLRLKGSIPEGGSKASSLAVSIPVNSPRLTVFTEVPNDRDGGKISAGMDTLTFFALLDQLNAVIEGEPDNQVKIANKTGRPGQTIIASHTVLGKDKEGRVYISVVAKDRPMIKFLFLPSEYHQIVNRDGSPIEESRLTQIYARAWHRMMSELVPNVLDTHWQEPQRGGGGGYNKGGGGGNQRNGGGGNYGNNGGGGGNSGGGQRQQHGEPPAGPPSDFDEFPM